MARMTTEQRLSKAHEEAIADFGRIHEVMRDERKQCLEDRRFYSIAGAQWEGALSAQFENKPRFEVNKVHLSVMRIINEYRNNRVTVDFVSKDGIEDDDLADACDGLYRADEQDSTAEEAYDNAFEEAVGGGFGAWRLRADYEDPYSDDDDRQRIRIEMIPDADSTVFFDLNATRQDKADAKTCYVLTAMTREAYEEEYGDDVSSWPDGNLSGGFDWATPNVVYVAEVYKVEEKAETVYVFTAVDGSEERYPKSAFDDDDDLWERLSAIGTEKVGQKKVTRRKVRKYIMSGGGVLEDCGHIAGTEIPIVPVYGKRWFVDNIERCMGHVRLAKDAQRLKNMQLSRLGEMSALGATEKPIMTPEQVAGHEMMWAEDNLKNYPYLLVNTMQDASGNEIPAGPVGYTKPPAVPPALAGLLQITEQDMQDILGKQGAGEEMVSNMSGKAVELVQSRLDMQSFIYLDNMAKAIKRSGQIWLSMARDILVEPGRKMKAIGMQGELSTVELLKPVQDAETGGATYANDLSKAKLDVAVEVGPSSSSRRAATVRALMGMIQISPDPETQAVLTAMAMMNMEGEGVSEVRGYFRKKLVQMGVLEPTETEEQEMTQAMEGQQPDPNALYLEAEAIKAQAQAVKAEADTEYAIARTEETRAKTAETLAGIETDRRESAVKSAKALTEIVATSQKR